MFSWEFTFFAAASETKDLTLGLYAYFYTWRHSVRERTVGCRFGKADLNTNEKRKRRCAQKEKKWILLWTDMSVAVCVWKQRIWFWSSLAAWDLRCFDGEDVDVGHLGCKAADFWELLGGYKCLGEQTGFIFSIVSSLSLYFVTRSSLHTNHHKMPLTFINSASSFISTWWKELLQWGQPTDSILFFSGDCLQLHQSSVHFLCS